MANFRGPRRAWEPVVLSHERRRPATSRSVGGPAGRSYFGSAVFIDPQGTVIGRAGDKEDEILYADIDPRVCNDTRDLWGFYQFRRPDAYGEILGATA